MVDYWCGAHTVFEIHLHLVHLVWITRYRRPALNGEVAVRVRDLMRDTCAEHEVKIMKEVIATYIAEQNIDQDEDFRVDG